MKLIVADYSLELEKNKILLYSTLLFLFVTGEVSARIFYYFTEENDLFWASKHVNKRPPGRPSELGLIDVIRISPNQRITYELIPDLEGILDGAKLEVNSQGFRAKQDVPDKKGTSEFRIVGFGDSEMLGTRLKFEDTYGEVLERELNSVWEMKQWFDF